MNTMYEVEDRQDGFAADASLDQRVAFIRRVYGHMLGATLLFVASAALFVNTPAIYEPLFNMLTLNKWGPLVLIGAFMVASWVAQSMAANRSSRGSQYFGLALYSVLEALIFTPLLFWVSRVQGSSVIMEAGTITLVIFGGLTTIVMLTRSDFSFLRNFLWVGSLAAFAIILVSAFTGGGLSGSTLFISAMIVLLSGWILYDTSNILHHYETDQHVAAALALFSSVVTLFWWVLRLMSSRD